MNVNVSGHAKSAAMLGMADLPCKFFKGFVKSIAYGFGSLRQPSHEHVCRAREHLIFDPCDVVMEDGLHTRQSVSIHRTQRPPSGNNYTYLLARDAPSPTLVHGTIVTVHELILHVGRETAADLLLLVVHGLPDTFERLLKRNASLL